MAARIVLPGRRRGARWRRRGRRRPAGFTVLAGCAGAFALLMAMVLRDPEADAVVRLMTVAWGGPALVTAEALWGARRWAHAASLALAGSVLLALLVLAVMAVAGGDGWTGVFLVATAGVCAFGLHPVLAYIRDRTRTLHAPPVP